jgi:anti-sigma factor RsiW
MNCNECLENLTAFLDGELSAADSEQVRSHLDLCICCADELRSLKGAAEFIKSHRSELTVPAESWSLIRARVAASPNPSRFFALLRPRFALASLALFSLLAIGYVQYQQIQRKNLNNYISQYIHDREVRRHARAVQWIASSDSSAEIPYADNPFIEIKASSVDNPFSTEDQ